MSDYAAQIVAARMQEVNAKLAARMREISNHTGVKFSDMFTQRIAEAAQIPEAEEAPEAAEASEEPRLTESDTLASISVSKTSRASYDTLIADASLKYGVDSTLIRAVIWAESNYNANAVGASGSQGLMQLMPVAAAAYGVSDPLDPAQNVDAGTHILADKLKLYDGDVRMALASYNAGSAGIANRGITDLSDPAQFLLLPKETQNYINRIESYLGAVS
ncbi:hypothetical protein FACS1894208_04680 [Clostridia bacterium]|nr:hypothetical protein FACS1894208_04680 [Clostridia bacterium]